MWLLAAIALSFAQHFLILYVGWFNGVFGVAPLSWAEWQLVLAVSAPVLLLDEALKLVTNPNPNPNPYPCPNPNPNPNPNPSPNPSPSPSPYPRARGGRARRAAWPS